MLKEVKSVLSMFEPFSLTNIIFSRKNRDVLAFIESCEIIDHYNSIRQDLEKTLIASYFIDLADHFSPEGKKNEKIFELLQNFLALLDDEKASTATVRFFEMRLLKLAGFEPALDHCIRCKTPVANGSSYYFYPRDGGIKCAACAHNILIGFISHVLGREVKSLKVMEQVHNLLPVIHFALPY